MQLIRRLFSWRSVLILFVIFAFIINALHESYPDEFDNILGGWYIAHGKLPYSGFFTHHGPVPYFIAAFVTLFSGQSFVRFRIVYAIVLIAIVFGTYILLKKRIGKEALGFYPLFIAFLGIESTYYWMQMILADNIAALAYLPVFALILLKALYRKSLTLFDVGAISILSAIGFYSSLTYTYLFLIVAIATLYLYFKNNYAKPLVSKRNLYPFFLLLLPHLLFLLYLIVTRSLADYYYQNVTFNALYYIYNYPRGEGATFINPLRYAILIAHWFYLNFYTLIMGVKNFDFAFPINMTMAVANLGLFLYLLVERRFKLAIFVLLVFAYTNVRSSPLDSKETDYQSAVYILISFFNMFFTLTVLVKSLNEKIAAAKKVIFGVLLIVVGVYALFGFAQLLFKFNEKVVSKYMGTMPLIYDRPRLAPIVNEVVGKDEYMWIGPFEFEELFYAKGKVPSKHHILIAGVGSAEKTRGEMLSDFQKNKPEVVMFDKNFRYLGRRTQDYSGFLLDFLNEHYVTLLTYRNGEKTYQSAIPVDFEIDLNAKMYIRKDKVEDVLQKLIEKNYVREVSGQ